MLDKRGTGLSDRVREVHSPEVVMDDVRAVMDDALIPLQIQIRSGVHTGECELNDGKIAGIAVSIGARISSVAAPGEVLVSSTVKDLVAGSGLQFEERGEHQLKGVPDPCRLYALSAEPALQA